MFILAKLDFLKFESNNEFIKCTYICILILICIDLFLHVF
jgi:hypothetical protein